MILLKNGTCIDWQTLEFTRADLLINEGDGGKISILPTGAPVPTGTRELDCTGKFITKAFANGHHPLLTVDPRTCGQ